AGGGRPRSRRLRCPCVERLRYSPWRRSPPPRSPPLPRGRPRPRRRSSAGPFSTASAGPPRAGRRGGFAAARRVEAPPPAPARACRIRDGAERVDATGLYVTPGLVDAHVHFCQTGWADGRPDAMDVRDRHPYEEVEAGLRLHPERFLRAYLCSGVTAVFDVGG